MIALQKITPDKEVCDGEVVSHQDGQSSGRSVIRTVSHQDGHGRDKPTPLLHALTFLAGK
jgi:hypothetical protein